MPKGERYFSIMGNLDWIIPRFIKMVPYHKNRVEVTFGAGEYLYHSDPPCGLEVINDIDPNLIRMHTIVKNLTNEQYEFLRKQNWVMTNKEFKRIQQTEPKTDIEFLYKYLYLFNGRNKSKPVDEADFFKVRGGIDFNTTPERVLNAHKRFKNLIIENMDALDIIKKYDSPETFFFLDPPYLGKERYYKEHSLDWEALCELLRNIQGKFLLVTSIQVDYSQIVVGTDYVVRSKRAFQKLCKDLNHKIYSNRKALNSILVKKTNHMNHFHVVYNFDPLSKFRSYFK